MKYRVRLDLSFDSESNAQALMNHIKGLTSAAVSINEGMANEEISFYELEICRHDDPSSGKGCEKLFRAEIRKLPPK